MYPQITIPKLFENPILHFQVYAAAPRRPSQSLLVSLVCSVLSDLLPQDIACLGDSNGTGGVQNKRFSGLPIIKEVCDLVFELLP